jgi:quercetin dioxygenase-like cupin family protein
MEKSRKLPTKAAKLIDLIQYQEASFVNRTLIDRKAGTVTLLAFDAKQGLGEHAAPYDALVQIIDGEAEVNISGTAHQLKAGETMIVLSKTLHSLKANEKFKMLPTIIRSA